MCLILNIQIILYSLRYCSFNSKYFAKAQKSVASIQKASETISRPLHKVKMHTSVVSSPFFLFFLLQITFKSSFSMHQVLIFK